MREDVIRFVDDEARVAFKDELDKYLRFFAAFLETNRVCEESAPCVLELLVFITFFLGVSLGFRLECTN